MNHETCAGCMRLEIERGCVAPCGRIVCSTCPSLIGDVEPTAAAQADEEAHDERV